VTDNENTLAYPVTELIKAVNTYDTGPWNSFFYFIKLESLGFQINSYDHLKAILWEGLAYHQTDIINSLFGYLKAENTPKTVIRNFVNNHQYPKLY
jgi:hypothetical protein